MGAFLFEISPFFLSLYCSIVGGLERSSPFFYNFFKFFLVKVFVFIKNLLYLIYQKTKKQ